MKRGRPKHDDVLTPREWQVLALLRDGLSNEEIARQLQISAATAKFHVSEILSKLGVQSRSEAAHWQGKPREFGFGVLTLPAFMRRRASLVAIATGMAMLVVIAALMMLGHSPAKTTQDEETSDYAGAGGEPAVESSGKPASAGPLPLTVCSSNETWQKPSRDEQERYMTTDYRPLRYGVDQRLTGRVAEAYEASFWSFGFSASGLFSMTDMSGLWTARDAGVDLNTNWPATCEGRLDLVAQYNLWLLGYAGESAYLDEAGTLTVRVRSRSPGFQAVQVRIEGEASCCPLRRPDVVNRDGPVNRIDFVGPDGAVIETLSDGIWSHP